MIKGLSTVVESPSSLFTCCRLATQEGIPLALGTNSSLGAVTGINNSVIRQYHKFGMNAIH